MQMAVSTNESWHSQMLDGRCLHEGKKTRILYGMCWIFFKKKKETLTVNQ